MLRKTLKYFAIGIAILLILAFSLPFIFKGKILSLAREQVNKNVNARVNFSDVDVSLFRHFPRLAVGLEDLQIVGNGAFSQDTLISADRIDVALNLMSLFGGSQMNIYSITVDKPRIHAIVHKDGKANWDISKADTSSVPDSGSPTTFHMQLQSYVIKDAYISYVDLPSDMSSEVRHLDHSGSGDFTADLFTLRTKTSAESVSFTYSKIPYLVDAKTTLSAD